MPYVTQLVCGGGTRFCPVCCQGLLYAAAVVIVNGSCGVTSLFLIFRGIHLILKGPSPKCHDYLRVHFFSILSEEFDSTRPCFLYMFLMVDKRNKILVLERTLFSHSP